MDGGLGTDCGVWFGACNPRELGFAAGGNWGIADDEDPVLAVADPLLAVEDPVLAVVFVVPTVGFDARDRPGATAETSAAKPAVSAAVAAITHRRVRPMRAIAASRASAARDLSSLLVIRCSSPIMTRLLPQGISAQ